MIFAEVEVNGVCAHAVRKRIIPAGIVGAQVSFSFTDPKWDNLNKTVVFKGFGTRAVILKGDTVRIPQEVVSRKDVRLLVGVYGTDAENAIAIPTLWADLGRIRDATDPFGDEAVDPTLPIWATLQAEIDKLKENGATDEQIATAVKAYLQENPIGTGTVKKVNDIEPDENGNIVIDVPTDYVKTVNGATPDENGNIEIEIPDSGSNVGYPDWSHLKWYVMGDSLTAKPEGSTEKRYYDFVHEKTGIQVIVDGIGGTGYGAGSSEGQSFQERVLNIPEDVDIVSVFGSGNDIRYGVAYDKPIWVALSWIATNRPGLRVIVAPPLAWKSIKDSDGKIVTSYDKRGELWKPYCDRLQVCALGCDFRYLADLYECPPFNPNFVGHQEIFFTTDPEGIHPNEEGHRALAPYFYNALAQELEFDAGSGINGSGGNADQSGGLSATASALLITILRNGVYSTDQSANITALEAALAGSGGSETPEPPASDVEQNGTILSIVSGVTVSQTGSVLAIA